MSFMKAGRSSQPTKGKKLLRPRKTSSTAKKDWVSTVNDLSVYKLSPQELSRRHELHQSHNRAVAQWELKEKALRQHLGHGGSPAPVDRASLSIIREVFSDQLLLRDVLARSDRALSVVKDLFGDAPRRQTGHPTVTMAPNSDADSALPVLQRPDPPTQLSLLSQSTMDQQALNELDDSREDLSEDGHGHLIHRGHLQRVKAKKGNVSQPRGSHQRSAPHNDGDGVPVTPCVSRVSEPAALNATGAVERVRSRMSLDEADGEEASVLVSQDLDPEQSPCKPGRTTGRRRGSRRSVCQTSGVNGSISGDRSSLGVLQSMLGQVEAELDSLMPDTPCVSTQSTHTHTAEQGSTQGLTGFSMALVSALSRLVHLQKERAEEAGRQAEERRKLEEELKEQKVLVDALRAETNTLKGESAALQGRFQKQVEELEQKLDTVILVLGGMDLPGMDNHPPPQGDGRASVCQPAAVAMPNGERPPGGAPPALHLRHSPTPVHPSSFPTIAPSPDQQSDASIGLLRPPSTAAHAQAPPPGVRRSYERARTPSSAASLPLSRSASSSPLEPLTSDPLRSPLSQEALLAEIAQLSRQNELLRAQWGRASRPGSEVGVEQGGSSPSSTGRVTPQGGGERVAGPRGGPHVATATAGRHTLQAPSQDVSSVQQRLLQLNRESAAASSRLLGLIEVQRQRVSSPSGSPIPSSAFSPVSDGGGRSPEGSVSSPAQAASNADRWRARGERETDGLALFAHLR